MSSVKRIDTFYVVINEDDGVLSSYRSIKCDSKEEADKLADRIRNNRDYCRNLNDSLAYNRRRLNEIDRGE